MKFELLSSLLYFTVKSLDHGDDFSEVENHKDEHGKGNVCHFTYEVTQCNGDASADCLYDPSKWAKVQKTSDCNHQCDSTEAQSPINIDSSKVQEPSQNSLSLKFDYDDSKENKWVLDPVDSLSYHAACTDPCTHTVTAKSPTQPEEAKFTLRQIHFHTPAEHTVGGELLDGEIHMVHQQGEKPEYLVLGLSLRAVDDEKDVHPLAKSLFGPHGFEYAINKGLFFTNPRFKSLISDGFDFYHYKGGLTTPPCTEAVQWFLGKKPINVNRNTIEAHKKVNGVTNLANAQALEGVQQSEALKIPRFPKYNVAGANKERANLSASESGGNNRPISENNKSTVYSGSAEDASGKSESSSLQHRSVCFLLLVLIS